MLNHPICCSIYNIPGLYSVNANDFPNYMSLYKPPKQRRSQRQGLRKKICLTYPWQKDYTCLLRNLSNNLFLMLIWNLNLYCVPGLKKLSTHKMYDLRLVETSLGKKCVIEKCYFNRGLEEFA